MKLLRVLLALGSLLALSRLAIADPHPYPHVALYCSTRGSGWPLIKADGTIDTVVAHDVARFGLVTINTTPFLDLRPDVIATLRRYNANLVLLGYDTFGVRFGYATAGTMWKAEWDALARSLLYDTAGQEFPGAAISAPWTNFGAEGVADTTVAAWIRFVAPARVDGAFWDLAGSDVWWAHGVNGLPIDFRRAGCVSAAAMDSARRVALVHASVALRAATPPGWLIVGNGTTPDALKREIWDGDMFEGWPYFRGGSQASIVAYLGAGPWSMVKSEQVGSYPYTFDNCRKARFGLGCAALGDGWACFGNRDLPASGTTEASWWFDEYAVTPIIPGRQDGRTDLTGRCTGWLGKYGATPTQMPSGAWRRDFANGLVLVNPTDSTVTVDLGAPYWRRIYGVRDPYTNNGLVERRPRIGPQDALFMLRIPRGIIIRRGS